MSGYVYVIQGESGGPVKIGWAIDPERRLRQLQCGSPMRLSVLACLSGEQTLEKHLHIEGKQERSHGEWFNWNARTSEWLRRYGFLVPDLGPVETPIAASQEPDKCIEAAVIYSACNYCGDSIPVALEAFGRCFGRKRSVAFCGSSCRTLASRARRRLL